MEIIRTIDALRLMEEVVNGERVRFDVKGTKYNRRQKAGGGVYHYRRAQLPYRLNPSQALAPTANKADAVPANKQPNHYKNATRNIQVEGSKDIKKLNIWLIDQVTFHNTGKTYQVVH